MAVRRRTDQVAVAVAAELDRQRAALNTMTGVRSVCITVRFKHGTDTPRVVTVAVETEHMLDGNGEVNGV